MSKWMKAVALALAASFAVAPAGLAATAKKAVKKPAAKAPAKPAPRVVLGTTQLPGESGCKFGTTYTLGKEYPLNVTLTSAEYTIDPVIIGDMTYVPESGEKLLVLHMTYHNPQKSECFVRWDTFSFTVVDPQNQNHDGLMDMGSEKDKIRTAMNMKPAQKSEFYGVMRVPAKGQMPKLMIKSGDNLVMRFDLKDPANKVKPLPAAYADPSDPTGCSALDVVEGVAGTWYPTGMLSFKFISAEPGSGTTMGEVELDEGQQFYIVNFAVKNVSTDSQFFRWDILINRLIDTDGLELEQASDMFTATKTKSVSTNIKPGQELTLRYIYKIDAETEVKSFRVNDVETERVFSFDID